jgi:hypothetical protein
MSSISTTAFQPISLAIAASAPVQQLLFDISGPKLGAIRKRGRSVTIGIEAPESFPDDGEVLELAQLVNRLKTEHAQRTNRPAEPTIEQTHIAGPMLAVLERYGITLPNG